MLKTLWILAPTLTGSVNELRPHLNGFTLANSVDDVLTGPAGKYALFGIDVGDIPKLNSEINKVYIQNYSSKLELDGNDTASIDDWFPVNYKHRRTIELLGKVENLVVEVVDTPTIGPVDFLLNLVEEVTEQSAEEVKEVTQQPVAEEIETIGKPTWIGEVYEEVTIEEVKEETKETETEVSDELEFDPLATALENSIEEGLKQQAEEEIKEEVTIEDVFPKGKTLEQLEDPEYPKVDMTVSYSNKLFSESKDPNASFMIDFAGSTKTYSRVFNNIERKVQYSLDRRKQPSLNDFETAIVGASYDSLANDEIHKQQYFDGSHWEPFVQTGKTPVPILSPINNPEYGSDKYVGADAVSLIQNRMKIGCKVGVFLPHTGLYFLVNSPSDEDVLDTLAIVNNLRVEILRNSSGILLGSSNYYLYRQLINLFINNVSACSLANWNKEVILSLIDERDMNIIATILAASIYPDGYEYQQICGLVKVDKTCEHITSKLVDLRRMIFVDNSRLSESQRAIALSGLRERSINEIRSYQEANYLGFKKAYEITEGISFVYKSQPIQTVIEAGEEWIKEIESTVDSIVTFNDDEDTRNTMISQRINLTRIREYSHWVVEIQVDNETNVITDKAKINELLRGLSRNQEVLEKVGQTLSEFQRLSQVAIVAIPRIRCPVCQQTNQKDLDISPHLIPQDAVSRFFTLARQRLS